MKIVMEKFKADSVRLNDRIIGSVRLPPNSRIIHAGAAPPKGELCIWAEVPSIALGEQTFDEYRLIILRHDDEIPDGWEFRGHILSNPILFFYQYVGENDDDSKSKRH